MLTARMLVFFFLEMLFGAADPTTVPFMCKYVKPDDDTIVVEFCAGAKRVRNEKSLLREALELRGAKRNKPKEISEPKIMPPKSRKRGVNSRAKGSAYERRIAKVFDDYHGGTWRRTPMSGGWSKSSDYGVAGDLVCTVETPLHVELKNREGWDLTDLLLGVRTKGTTSILEWWKQTSREAKNNKKQIPLLIFRRNRLSDSLVMLKRAKCRFDLCTETPEHFVFRDKKGFEFVIVSLRTYLQTVAPPRTAPGFKRWSKRTIEERVECLA